MPPQDENKEKGAPDPSSFLLPKKPAPGMSVDSARRINAGALLEAEQQATLPKKTPPPPFKPPAPKPEEPMIAPLQTYKGDIESLIQTTNTSTVSIAAAEAARRAGQPVAEAAPSTDWKKLLKRAGMVAGGVVLLAGAGGMLYFAYSYFNATAPVPQGTPAPFISVDATTPVILPAGLLQRTTLVDALEAARVTNPVSLGLIERLVVLQTATEGETETYVPLAPEDWLPVLAPNIPAELLRTLTGTHLLGVHTYDGTQAFLLLETDSYERAFAGMLAWERAMRGDLLPLFNREPRPRLPEEGVPVSEVGVVPQLLQTGFSDQIIENRDARVVLNTSGDILLLWTPLTPNLFVITTNEYTLRELISRLGL